MAQADCVLAVCAQLVAMMHGATEPITVAFQNIGFMENAFAGRHAEKHMSSISKQVFELLQLHLVNVFCFVEVGQP